MTNQVPPDGYYFVQMSDGSPKIPALLKDRVVENVFGRTYKVENFQGIQFGERIPTEEECAAMKALVAWKNALVKLAEEDRGGVIAKVLTAFPPPKD